MFGDAREGIEELIIRAARDTHSLPGEPRGAVARCAVALPAASADLAGKPFPDRRALPVGAFGLTQIMPATASDLGINPAYYDDPYLQVTGGARYLAMMLNMFDGNIIHALAAYNAGPGNVQDYGGVPPFAETQHYVVVIPQQYNSYLAAVGGIDALGTIDPVLWRMRVSASRPWRRHLWRLLAGLGPRGRPARAGHHHPHRRDRDLHEAIALKLCARRACPAGRDPHPDQGRPHTSR